MCLLKKNKPAVSSVNRENSSSVYYYAGGVDSVSMNSLHASFILFNNTCAKFEIDPGVVESIGHPKTLSVPRTLSKAHEILNEPDSSRLKSAWKI